MDSGRLFEDRECLIVKLVAENNTQMDIVSKDKRSEMMSNIRSTNTKPELVVRRLVYSLGYRYRLHCKDLPGKPDLVFRGKKKVIFVHGCFWHQHQGCSKASIPKSRPDFWRLKLSKNVERDERAISSLTRLGWGVLVIWECEINFLDLPKRILEFLE